MLLKASLYNLLTAITYDPLNRKQTDGEKPPQTPGYATQHRGAKLFIP
ncbi:MAG: hypothetical protein QW057_09950 [Candidatus Bathyarchaeia archaeon]